MRDERFEARVLFALTASICVTALACATPGRAAGVDDESAAERRRIEAGRLTYEIHCASCHGPAGRGDGPVAAVLTVRPTDLTTLAAARGGEFPADELTRTIDGRDEISGHGARTMPVWGLAFRQTGSDADQERQVAHRIDNLVRYVRTIQRGAQD